MGLKDGYRQTEVGVIPQTWGVKPLFMLSTEIGDGIHSTPKYAKSSEFHFINGNNLVSDHISITDSTMCISEVEFKALRKNLTDRTILLSINGTIGNLAFYNGEQIVLGKSAAYINVAKCVSRQFISYCLKSRPTSLFFDNELTGTTIRNLSLQSLRNTPIPLPPTLTEQHAIAEALSGVDALLVALDRLIAKKRDLKQAVMQQLLTGQTRLPGFQGEWEVKRLKTMLQTPVTDGPHLTPKFLDDGVPFLSVNNLAENRIDLRDLRFISQADHELFSRKCKPQRDDILLGKAASVGKVALVELDVEFNIWSPIALIRVNSKNAPIFVFYLLQSANLVRQIMLLTNSSSQGNIGMGDIERLKLNLPGLLEQTAIAKVLSDMDAELSALEQRRNKTRDLKQAMMQELLTGSIRLV